MDRQDERIFFVNLKDTLSDTDGTFHSDIPGTFESDMGGTFKVLQSVDYITLNVPPRAFSNVPLQIWSL